MIDYWGAHIEVSGADGRVVIHQQGPQGGWRPPLQLSDRDAEDLARLLIHAAREARGGALTNPTER
jgi:hypothetical protein